MLKFPINLSNKSQLCKLGSLFCLRNNFNVFLAVLLAMPNGQVRSCIHLCGNSIAMAPLGKATTHHPCPALISPCRPTPPLCVVACLTALLLLLPLLFYYDPMGLIPCCPAFCFSFPFPFPYPLEKQPTDPL